MAVWLYMMTFGLVKASSWRCILESLMRWEIGARKSGWGLRWESNPLPLMVRRLFRPLSFQEFLESLIDPVRDQVTRHAYDSLGPQGVWRWNAGGGATEFRYNSAGQLALDGEVRIEHRLRPSRARAMVPPLSVSAPMGCWLHPAIHRSTRPVYQVRARMRQLSGTGTVYVGISSRMPGAPFKATRIRAPTSIALPAA